MENQLTDRTILTKLWLFREIGNNFDFLNYTNLSYL